MAETRPDLVVGDVTFDPAAPQEGDPVAVTALVRNIGVSPTTAALCVGFYLDGTFVGLERVTDAIPAGARPHTPATGDFNMDGKVDKDDLTLWRQQYNPVGLKQPRLSRPAGDQRGLTAAAPSDAEEATGAQPLQRLRPCCGG